MFALICTLCMFSIFFLNWPTLCEPGDLFTNGRTTVLLRTPVVRHRYRTIILLFMKHGAPMTGVNMSVNLLNPCLQFIARLFSLAVAFSHSVVKTKVYWTQIRLLAKPQPSLVRSSSSAFQLVGDVRCTAAAAAR